MHHLIKLSVSMLTILLVSGCQLATQQMEVNIDDYPVYSAYLNKFQFYRNVPKKDTVLIGDSTAIDPTDVKTNTPWSWQVSNGDHLYKNDMARCEEARSKVWEPLFTDMKKQFYQPRLKLRSYFTVSYPTQILSQQQMAKRSDWDTDPESASHYIFRFSNIVYDTPKTRALFFSSFWCGGLCGRGELVMLKKVNQRWVLIETFKCWIS